MNAVLVQVQYWTTMQIEKPIVLNTDVNLIDC